MIDGIAFDDSIGLGKALGSLPQATDCLVDRTYAYAVGQAPGNGQREWMEYLRKQFASDGYRVPGLMRRIAQSEVFYRVNVEAGKSAESDPVKSTSRKSQISDQESKS